MTENGCLRTFLLRSAQELFAGSLFYRGGEEILKIASMVTGILSLIFCFVPLLGVILGVVAVITARTEGKVEGMAVAGLTCGIIGLCIGVVTLGVMGCTACSLASL